MIKENDTKYRKPNGTRCKDKEMVQGKQSDTSHNWHREIQISPYFNSYGLRGSSIFWEKNLKVYSLEHRIKMIVISFLIACS